jgi:diguanylate cyclase (GGDEF)-like protein
MMVHIRRSTIVVAAAAATLTAGSLLVGLRAIEMPLLDRFVVGADFAGKALVTLLVAVGIVAISQLVPMRVRVGGRGNIRLVWGEAAIVVVCAGVPPALVPATVLVGVAFAHGAMSLFGIRQRPADVVVFGVSALTVAASLAVAIVAATYPAYDVPLQPHVIAALCIGTVAYTLCAVLLVTGHMAAAQRGGVGRTFFDTMSSKWLMMVGNIAVGLLIIWIGYTNAWFLVLLPPLFWLLHQFYAHRLRGDDDRRTWQEFAEATRDLNRLDERDAVAAGIAGALRLFRATSAEIVVEGAHGYARAYRGERDGELRAVAVPEKADDAASAPAAKGDEVSRPLLVRQVCIGELRLFGVAALRSRDRLMLAAYGDALAAAVHDAVTHDELRTLSERTTYDAIHDPLTGLVNRAALLARGNSALSRLVPGAPVALLLLDIDHFKEVNNALGHTAGDELLKVIARRVSDSGGAGDLLARLGGDEFALLLTELPPDSTDTLTVLTAAVERARKLGEQVAVPTEVTGVLLSVEASIGVVVALAGAVDMTELLRRADIAMYQAKRGGQPVAWYDAIRDGASTDQLALLAELREALSTEDQLTLVLQPAVSLGGNGTSAGQITGVEALVRWQHPRRGRLTPDQFIPIVELSELIGPLTLRVLDRALALAARWRSAGIAVPISVNLSARSLLDRRLPGQVGALLTQHRFPAELLVLEITESVVMSELPVIDDVLAGIRRLGVQLAVDDFGTGYSSLTFLTRVQVEEVKIDRVFVARMVDSPEAAAIVRTTVELGRELGLRVVAEGVETAEQRAMLVQLGCTSAQGYHFYRPLAAEEVTAVLRERRQGNRRHLRAEDTG